MSHAPSMSVPRVGRVPQHVFERDYLHRGQPVVFEGLIADWSTLDWGFEPFARRWPTRAVGVEERTSGDPFDIFAVRSDTMELAELARRVTDDRQLDSQRLPFLYCKPRREMPELLAEANVPAILAGRELEWTLLGGRDPVIPAHYHSHKQVLLCQIHGKKRVVLYPPEDTSRLYPYPIHSAHYSMSRANLIEPDTRRFPKLAATHRVEVALGPGDAMFLPIHWWHTSFGIGTSLAITLAWDARLRDYRFPTPGLRTFAASVLLKAQGRLRSLTSRSAGLGRAS